MLVWLAGQGFQPLTRACAASVAIRPPLLGLILVQSLPGWAASQRQHPEFAREAFLISGFGQKRFAVYPEPSGQAQDLIP